MILSTFLEAIATILQLLVNVYSWVIIITALVSLVQANPYNPIVQFLYRITEPLYAKIRKIIPTIFGGIDFAPLFVLIVLQFISLFFIKVIRIYANSL
ncbi:MAG: YggT family protein [Helicobacteraceae bacterium]|nr:YggT family protein [Helicobacteraceae bacterium]